MPADIESRVRIPRRHAGQVAVMAEAKRFNWLCAGRRWRKTTLLAHIAVRRALQGGEVLWTAPVYDQVHTGWEECERALAALATFNKGRMTMAIPGRGRITFRSLDNPQSARSKTADLVLVDEAGDVDPRAWPEVLRPMLLTTQGDAWFCGTPRGLNWFWEGWDEAGARADSARWQIPTLGCRIEAGELVREPHPLENPTIPWEEMFSAWEQTPERLFRQEYIAEWLDSGDAVFRTADIEAMQVGWTGLKEPAPHRKYLSAWDIGRRSDPTVGITIDYTDLRWQIVAFHHVQGLPYPAIQAAIEERHRAYGGRTIVESNGPGDPVIENLGVHVEGFVTTARSKTDSITALQLCLERGAIKGGISRLLRELKAYRWADKDLQQDCVMALAIAAKHLPRPSRTSGQNLYTPRYRQRAALSGVKRQEF